MQSLQYLYSRFEKCTPFKIYHDCQNVNGSIPELLSTGTMDDWLRTNNKVTASKLKAKLLEQCTNFPDVDLSTMINRLENHYSSVMLSCGL